MLSDQPSQQPFSGMLQPGYLSEGQAARAVEQFLRAHLPDWIWLRRQQGDSQQAENTLTGNLCRFVRSRCRRAQTLFDFFFEFPQTGKRRVDIGVHGAEENGLYVANQLYGLDDAFYTLEAKRLPTPDARREREYVVGDGSKQSGGIERFKENLHADGLLYSGMIAYVQEDSESGWLEYINQWILALAANPPKNARSRWSQDDVLHQETAVVQLVQEFSSIHHRVSGHPIQLRHFWLYLLDVSEPV